MLFLGIEINQSGTQVVALDLEAARIVEEASFPHPWIEGLPGEYREQDPAAWIAAADHAMRQCLSRLGEEKSQVAAMSVAGPMRGMVALDAENRIVRPAKMAGDMSTRRQAEEIALAFGGAPGLIEMTGNPVSAESAAAECLWLKQHEPYHFQRAACLLSAQDFIAYWLTGERATEPGSASASGLFDVRSRAWSGELVDYIDPGLRDLLPLVASPLEPRGALRPALARAWGLSQHVLVGAGSCAPMLAVVASGSVDAGSVSIDLGSVGMTSGVGGAPLIDLRGELASLCDATGQWLAMAETSNAVAAPELIRRQYGWSPAQFDAAADSISPGADGLLFLPYLTGEKTPRLPDGRGVLHGISLDNFTPAHLARAAAEGVALGIGYGLSRLRDMGFDPREIRLTGSGADGVMRQLLADTCGVAVTCPATRQGAAVGAAIQAAVAFFRHSGESLGFGEMVKYLVTEDLAARREPDMARHEQYQGQMSRQQYLVATLHPGGFL
jgi:xylulokinase